MLCVALIAAAGAFAAAAKTADDPVAVVKAFYTFHFSHDMAFTEKGLAARAAWLAPDLTARCKAYFALPSSPDEVPEIDGDPFTDSQEYPTSFKVGKVLSTKDKTEIAVTFSGGGGPFHPMRVVLVKADGAWRISDFLYESGPSFRALLEPEK